ncbi:MAG TPA: VWA domain-containing protein [Terracidiphilus sp.]|nr:VWA domain-containing protein [Terracidiphilus sp.]
MATFRVEVRRVPVDVEVTDKHGNPVTGLKAKDFRVKEDGKPQKILSFNYYDGQVMRYVPGRNPILPADTYVNLPRHPERGPLYILYYDMVNTDRVDQMLFRAGLLKFVEEAPEGTRIALFVNAAGMHLLQGFTSDHALLREAILRQEPGPHAPKVFIYGREYGWQDSGAALSNLTNIAEYLQGIPGKKNLIWLADYFPIPLGPSMIGTGAAGTNRGGMFTSAHGLGGPELLDLSELQSGMVKHCFSAMMRSQIVLYPVDLKGLDPQTDAGDLATQYATDQAIADITGGQAFHSNRPDESLLHAMAAGESYYELSYEPSNLHDDGSARHIQLELAKKQGYTLSYRMLYYALPENSAPTPKQKVTVQSRFMAAKTADTLYANIEHGAPTLHDLLFSAHVTAIGKPALATTAQMGALEDSPKYFKTRRRSKPLKTPKPVMLEKYQIAYGVFDPVLKKMAAQQRKPAMLEFAAAAYDADGMMLNSMLNEGIATLGSAPGGKAGGLFHGEQELEVPEGAVWLRLAVRDRLSDRTGTLEIRLPAERALQASVAERH